MNISIFRAVAEIPLDKSLWIDFALYCSDTLKQPGNVIQRAVRNCPWSVDLWRIHMSITELYEVEDTFDKIKTVFEKGILYCCSPEDAYTLWMSYLSCLVRLSKGGDETLVDITRKTFTAAEEHLLQRKLNVFAFSILSFDNSQSITMIICLFLQSLQNLIHLLANFSNSVVVMKDY